MIYLMYYLQTFAGWGVDYLKVDGCHSNPSTFDIGYPKFSQALNATGRPILLSCEWPDYQTRRGMKVLLHHCSCFHQMLLFVISIKNLTTVFHDFLTCILRRIWYKILHSHKLSKLFR